MVATAATTWKRRQDARAAAASSADSADQA
jgi:hypothetical protein